MPLLHRMALSSWLKARSPWLAVLACLTLAPAFLNKFYLGLMVQVFILAVFALSYDLLMGYSGILSFGHAMFFGSGAYVVGLLLKGAAWPLYAALPIIIVAAALMGVLVGIVTLRVRGVYFAMITLAFAEVIYILSASSQLRPWTGGDEGLHGIPVPAWMSPTAERVTFYYLSLSFLVLMYFLARRIVNSPTGRVLIAIRENESRAATIGYNVFWYKVLIIVISGVLAALAGGLNALYFRNATPEVLGVGRTIDALLMTIIGGMGTLIGPVLGAVVIRVLGNYLADWFGPRWPLVFGLIFVALVMFFPWGIVGTVGRLKPALRSFIKSECSLQAAKEGGQKASRISDNPEEH